MGPRSFLALALVTLATLMLQVLLTRIFSVTLWYHFAFMAVSIAMFGLTLGAVLVYLRPLRFPAERAREQMAAASLGFAIATVLCFVAHLYVPLVTGTGAVAAGGGDGSFAATLVYLGLTYALVSIPFVLSGIAVCLALTRFPAQLPRLYAADLAGAAIGCVTVVLLLRVVDAPTAVVAVAACAAAGAWLFASDAPASGRLRSAAIAATALLGAGVVALALLARDGRPLLRPLFVKGERAEERIWERWSSYAHVGVFGRATPVQPSGGGLSERVRARAQRQLRIEIDASAGTIMTQFAGDLAALEHLSWDVSNLAHHLRRDADVLVIGVGGGRDILSALHFQLGDGRRAQRRSPVRAQ